MPYNLFVIHGDRAPYKTLRSPYGDRRDSIRTVLMILTGCSEYPFPDGGRAQRFAEQVATAPLGETVTHTGLNISFRTEETTS